MCSIILLQFSKTNECIETYLASLELVKLKMSRKWLKTCARMFGLEVLHTVSV